MNGVDDDAPVDVRDLPDLVAERGLRQGRGLPHARDRSGRDEVANVPPTRDGCGRERDEERAPVAPRFPREQQDDGGQGREEIGFGQQSEPEHDTERERA